MSHDDFNFEPIRGLPEKLPEGEVILWQGSPDAWRLAREALWLDWVAGYFAILCIARVGVSSAEMPFVQALNQAVPLFVAGSLACAVLYGLAYIQARSAVYTLTNKRVVMRIGAALTMTLNLPYIWIGNANLDLRKGGTGTIAFELIGQTRFSYFVTWPHTRPWYLARTQPALRCVPDAERVAAIFAEAADARVSEPQLERAPVSAVAAE